MTKYINSFSCPNDKCKLHGKIGDGNIRHHGYVKTIGRSQLLIRQLNK
jgi:hypothetical protein